MKIYVAGPMRGIKEFNFPAFNAATEYLRALGHEVFNPAERDLQIGFDPAGMDGTDLEVKDAGFDLLAALGADLAWIAGHADCVVVLSGWRDSLGAQAEVTTARAPSIPVYAYSDLQDRMRPLA